MKHIKNDEYTLKKTRFGFWQIYPLPTNEFLTDYYKNSYSDELEKVNVEEKIVMLESLVEEKTVFDIGCGDGALLQEFKSRNWQVAGVEPSSVSKDKELYIINNDFEKVDFEKKYDVVILNFVLEHHPDPEYLLKRIRDEVLKKNGILLIEVPNDFNRLQLAAEATCKTGKYWIKYPDHLNYFSFTSLENLVQSIGYCVIHKEATFPLELFILMGENYIFDKSLGKGIHKKRVQFEMNLKKAGELGLKHELYRKFAEIGIGRSIIMYCKMGEG